MNWQNAFKSAVQRENLDEAIGILQAHATSHAGTPNAEIKSIAFEILIDNILPKRANFIAERLLKLETPTASEMACSLLAHFTDHSQKIPINLLVQVASDANWEVREFAAGLIASVIKVDFAGRSNLLTQFISNESENVRRAAIVAVKYLAKERNLEWKKFLLSAIQPALTDRREYVRTNLGPFAIGDGLLRCYPEDTKKHLVLWRLKSNEVVRWNVAMALSTAEARKDLPFAMSILHELAADDRRFVWRAVASAARKHAIRNPKYLAIYLRRWKSDKSRQNVYVVVSNAMRNN